jgi:hypothetical protein
VPAFLRPFLAPAPIILPDASFVLHVAVLAAAMVTKLTTTTDTSVTAATPRA